MGSTSPSYKGHRYPVEVISHCVWLYFRFPLAFREVEEPMLERGVVVSHETVRRWCAKFGQAYTDSLHRRRPRPGDKWHLDEVFIKINGEQKYLWRAVDKSHMLIALGTEAAMKGYRVRYTLATKLVNELVEAADEKQLNKAIARYGRVGFLCIDQLGYMELDRHGAELLFQVLTEREEKNNVAIASNESFGGWTKTFTDPRLCAAIVDRLTFNGTIIETGTDSYRLASTRARAEEPSKAG
ncbi:ATP-binding protein [Streptomyces sp. NPDC014623]|uniref:ATP-binding protein n=1 Tax=Streptomyces sp. NPDC014623 TaxID=3364875 RepID=UPI0037016A93